LQTLVCAVDSPCSGIRVLEVHKFPTAASGYPRQRLHPAESP
jgi:hypothetical protein